MFISGDGKFPLLEMILGEEAVLTFSLQLLSLPGSLCLTYDWGTPGLQKAWAAAGL